MKILTKFILLLVAITWSLHYYCQIGQCSVQLQRVCHYTTPSVWEELMLEKNEFYREQLDPKVKILKTHISKVGTQYKKKIVPKLIDLGNHFYLEIVSPRIDDVCQIWEEFDSEVYREWSLRQVRRIRKQIWFYYSVYLKPSLGRLDSQYALTDKYQYIYSKLAPVGVELTQHFQDVYNQVVVKVQPYWEAVERVASAKWGPVSRKVWNRCRSSELCFKTNEQLNTVWKNLNVGYRYLVIYVKDALAPYTDDLKSNVRATRRSKSKPRARATTSAVGNVKSGGDAGVKTSTSEALASAAVEPTMSASTTMEAGFEDYYNDEEPISTTTSTIMLTVTKENDQNELSSPQRTTEAGLEISEQDAVKDEFEAWFRVVNQKSSGVVKTFNREVKKYLDKRVKELDSVFQNKTLNMTQALQRHYKNLNRAIQDINCTCEADATSGNVTCFDSTGTTQLPEYITRAKVRALFADAHETLDQSMLVLKQDLEPVAQEVEKRVNLIREEMVEVYEEWGDAMVSEWSKRLAYIDVVAGHLDENDGNSNEESSENWRKFLNLKKQVIKARDELVECPANLQEIKQFAKKVHYLVDVLTSEAGEYLYILRARANLAFQAREQVTNQREDSQRMAQDSSQSVENSNVTTASVKKSDERSHKMKNATRNELDVTNKFSIGSNSSDEKLSKETTAHNNVTLQD